MVYDIRCPNSMLLLKLFLSQNVEETTWRLHEVHFMVVTNKLLELDMSNLVWTSVINVHKILYDIIYKSTVTNM